MRASPDASRLQVSANRRFLVRGNGEPFFWLGDTAWELFHRLDRQDANRYLEDRARKGFTVVQAVVLSELDGLNTPNPYGHRPLRDHDPTRPNESYFEHVDWIVNRAEELGLFIGMLPTWGDKWNQRWGVGPEVFTSENAAVFGEFLGKRYRDKPIVWILGGDRSVDTNGHREIIRAMARGLTRGDGGRHLKTFHPSGGEGSSTWFHDEDWLDFNMRQNGHVLEFNPSYENTRRDYERGPTVKPVVDGEPLYEGHPVAFKADAFGHSLAADVRRPLYWDLFSGAFGHTYGHHSVWQMWTPERTPVNNPLMPWHEALDEPGAGQMRMARRLLESRPFLTRVPDDTVVVPSSVPTSVPGAGTRRFVATRAADRRFAMVYAPVGRPFAVNTTCVVGSIVRAWWYDPRTGSATCIGGFPNRGEREFSPPATGEHMDWVLVLDDAGCDVPPPGERNET